MIKEFKFKCTGHENVLSLHSKTLEFTKDDFLTPTGDCIIGINANYDYSSLREFIDQFECGELLVCTIECDGVTDEFEFNLDKSFSSEHEIVFRRSDFKSDRTLGHRCTKCASNISREIVGKLKNSKVSCEITFKK